MDDLTRSWIYQYLELTTSRMESELYHYHTKTLQNCDGLDIIEYIELLQRYRQAVAIQQDIIRILALGDDVVDKRNYTK